MVQIVESYRQRGLVVQALKELGILKIQRRETNEEGKRIFYYSCTECNVTFAMRAIMLHFRNRHDETYQLLNQLLKIWGLVGDNPLPEEPDGIEPSIDLEIKPRKEFRCSCGLVFNSNGSLFNHRMKEGHLRILRSKKQLPVE